MNVLAIGNSFSEDATRYLRKIADADGVNIEVVNLFIGGCPLSKHYANLQTDEKAYSLQCNGEDKGTLVSLKEIILSHRWDYITLQQVSHESVDYATYQPYLNEIVAYIREVSPDAKIAIHQTWAYEQDSDRLCNELKYLEQSEMFADIKAAYDQAAKEIGADMIIPSGEMFQRLIESGMTVHRDTFHASLGLGRYALGLLWYVKLTGRSVAENTFCQFDEVILAENVKQIKQIVETFKDK